MSLDIGTLVGHLGIDTTNLKAGLQDGKQKLSDFADSAGKLLAVGGAAGGALLVAGLVKAMDLQGANAKLAGQLGLTADEAARYGQIAGKVYSDNWGESIDDVNEAIKSITQNIGEGSDQWLQDTTETVLAMSDTFGVGADEISRSVAQMLNTGLAENSQQALDILTKGFQNGNDRAGDLLDTFTEYGTQFRKLGVDGPAAMGLISQGLQGGARDADLVADSIKEFSIRAVDGSTTTAAGFAAIGLSAGDMAAAIGAGGASANGALDLTLDRLRAIPDPVARAQAATALFGTQAEDLGSALFDLDPSSATDALGEFTDAASTMADTVGNTAAGNIESFKRQVTTTFVSVVGGKLLPIVSEVTSFLSSNFGPAIDAVTGFFHRHEETVKTVAVGLGVFVGVIATVIAVTKAWALATAALNLVMDANPIGLVVIAIAAFVAGLVIAYKKVEWFRDLVNGAWAVIKAGFSVLASAFMGVWDGIIKPVWNAFAATVTSLWQSVLQPAFAWISAKWDELSGKLQLLWQTRIQPSLAALGEYLRAVWQDYGQKLVDWWNTHWPAIAATLQAVWANFIQPVLSALFSMFGAIVDYIQEHWPQITATIKGGAQIIGTAFTTLGTIIGAAWAVITGIWSLMKATWAVISGAISTGAHAVATAFSAIGTAASTAWTALTTAWSGAVAWFTGLKDTIVNALSTAKDWLVDAGKAIIDGLVTGINNGIQKVKDAVAGLADLIPGPIKKLLGINSPSRVMAEQVGQWIPKGIAMGIDQHAGVVDSAMSSLVSIPTVSTGVTRGGDGVAAAGLVGGAGTYVAKQVNQEVNVTGWEAREVDNYLDMLVGTA